MVVGTRPEAIKVAPIVRVASTTPDMTTTVVSTGQHREMTRELFHQFGVTIDHDLDIGRPGQNPNDIAARTIGELDRLLARIDLDVALVQGDTTSAMAAAITAFNRKVPVVHLEAGLRSGSLAAPFPEEANRRLVAAIASLHLAPTPRAQENLLAEGIARQNIVVTGNSVIDALSWTIQHTSADTSDDLTHRLATHRGPVVLATVHRRESWGDPLHDIAAALATICADHPEVLLVLPLHPNPVVRGPLEQRLRGVINVELTDPLPYEILCRVLHRATLVVSDSGGIQEEAPALGVPVIVLRDTTERVEAVEAGVAHLAGTDRETIVKTVDDLLSRPRTPPGQTDAPILPNPFGDGRAAERSIAAVLWRFAEAGAPPAPFIPG